MFAQIINDKITGIFANFQPDIEGVVEIADDDARIAIFNAPTILHQIAAIEASITPRRTRDATLAAAKTASSRTADDIAALAWMTDINTQIAALRVQL